MSGKEEVVDTSDYKLDKHGKKIKAHRIVFNKGEDDGKKGISEMKKTFNSFVEQHTLPLTEEELAQLETELNEVLGKDAQAGDWIHDFVHSDNPKFAGKSKDKRKQMALAAYYAKQRNEATELKGGQKKLDKNKNGKLDSHDFKLLRKEEAELDEALHPEAGKVLKHIKPEHHAKYKADLAKGVYKGDYADRTAVLKAAENAGHLKEELEEGWDDMLAHVKKSSEKSKTSTATKHDVKKTSTGTVYTKQRDADGNSKEFKRDPETAKRGRGRPKKNSFGEAAEFLMSLDDQLFESMIEEGLDAFVEYYAQLDELSKTTLGSYAKKASVDAKFHGYDAGYAQGDAQARAKRQYHGSTAGSAQDDKAHKRLKGVKKAIDRLTK